MPVAALSAPVAAFLGGLGTPIGAGAEFYAARPVWTGPAKAVPRIVPGERRNHAIPSRASHWFLYSVQHQAGRRCRFIWAHNPKVGGSNPPPATNSINHLHLASAFPSTSIANVLLTSTSDLPRAFCIAGDFDARMPIRSRT